MVQARNVGASALAPIRRSRVVQIRGMVPGDVVSIIGIGRLGNYEQEVLGDVDIKMEDDVVYVQAAILQIGDRPRRPFSGVDIDIRS